MRVELCSTAVGAVRSERHGYRCQHAVTACRTTGVVKMKIKKRKRIVAPVSAIAVRAPWLCTMFESYNLWPPGSYLQHMVTERFPYRNVRHTVIDMPATSHVACRPARVREVGLSARPGSRMYMSMFSLQSACRPLCLAVRGVTPAWRSFSARCSMARSSVQIHTRSCDAILRGPFQRGISPEASY